MNKKGNLKFEQSGNICFEIGEEHFAGSVNIFNFDFTCHLAIVAQQELVKKPLYEFDF